MDISNEDIAKLVLGYLKFENYKSAEQQFLVSSRYLQVIPGAAQHSKRFTTHVYGYCLTEMLKEYAQLYTIIIEYLEETIYPNEFTNRDMPSKLIFLLQNAKYTRSSTPNRSPIRSLSPKKICNINGTLVHELGSNNNVDGSDKKCTEKEEESDVITDNPEDKNDQEGSIGQVFEDFLGNKELQDKQVENINSMIRKLLDETLGCNATTSANKDIMNNFLNNLIGRNDCESGPDEQDKYTKNIDSDPPAKKARHSENMCTPNERSMTENTKPSPKQVVEPADSPLDTQIIIMEGTKVDSIAKQNLENQDPLSNHVLNGSHKDKRKQCSNLRDESEQAAMTTVTTGNAQKSPKSPDKDPIQINLRSDSEKSNVNEMQDLQFNLVRYIQVPKIERKCNTDEDVKKEVIVTKVQDPFVKVNYNQGSNSIEGKEKTQKPRRKSHKSASINKCEMRHLKKVVKQIWTTT